MTPHDWKILGGFALVVGGLSLYDSRMALGVVGAAALVVAVRNYKKIPVPKVP